MLGDVRRRIFAPLERSQLLATVRESSNELDELFATVLPWGRASMMLVLLTEQRSNPGFLRNQVR